MQTYERRTKTTMNDLANEVRSYMEQTNQTNQTLLNQMEKSNQALLQALKNMGNLINNLRNQPNLGRQTSSIHSENNNVTSSSSLPQPTFLPRRINLREEEGIEQPLTSTKDIARIYAALEPHIREAVSFREFCADKRRKIPRGYVNEELKRKVSKVAMPTFNGTGEMSAHQWLEKLNTFFILNPMTEEEALQFAIILLEGGQHMIDGHKVVSH